MYLKLSSTYSQNQHFVFSFLYQQYNMVFLYIYLYNDTPSKAIVNAASNITYRSLIEADDTGR
jgi:hypothetical protein